MAAWFVGPAFQPLNPMCGWPTSSEVGDTKMTEPNVPANSSETSESDSALRVSPPAKKKRKWLKATLIGLALVIVLGVPLAYVYICASARRFYGFAIYGSALQYYQEEVSEFPPSIEALEQAYNQVDYRRVTFGEDSTPRRPMLRPPPPGCHGPFVVMVEYLPVHWYLRGTRYVIRACGDGPCRDEVPECYKLVQASELDDLLRQDDALRQECRPATP